MAKNKGNGNGNGSGKGGGPKNHQTAAERYEERGKRSQPSTKSRLPGQQPLEPTFGFNFSVMVGIVTGFIGSTIRLLNGKFVVRENQRTLVGGEDGKVTLKLSGSVSSTVTYLWEGDHIIVMLEKGTDNWYWTTVANWVNTFPTESVFRSVNVNGTPFWRGFGLPGPEVSTSITQLMLSGQEVRIKENIGNAQSQLWVPMPDRMAGARWIVVCLLRSARQVTNLYGVNLDPEVFDGFVAKMATGEIGFNECEAEIASALQAKKAETLPIADVTQDAPALAEASTAEPAPEPAIEAAPETVNEQAILA